MLNLNHLDHLGDALRQLRGAARFTQADVCGRTGLRAPQLSRWENGHEIPTLESLVKVLNALGASLADFERVLLGNENEDRQTAVARELRQIRCDHRKQMASSSELRRALADIMRPNPEGLEPGVPFLEKNMGSLGSKEAREGGRREAAKRMD